MPAPPAAIPLPPPRTRPSSPTSSPARPRSSRPRRPCTTRPRSTSSSTPRGPRADDVSLDVACGPGSVVWPSRAACAAPSASTPPRRCWTRRAGCCRGSASPTWRGTGATSTRCPSPTPLSMSSAAVLPSITCSSRPRLRRDAARLPPGGRVVLCDAVASDDAAKAAAFNAMERLRDPSTVEFRPLGFLLALFRNAGLPEPTARFYQVPAERDRLLAASFPADDDRAGAARHDRPRG